MNTKKPNLSVFTGFVCCFAMIITGIATNGGILTILNFVHIPSMIVTFGGSIFAVLITTDSFGEFVDGVRSFSKAFSRQPESLDTIGTQIYQMAQLSRKEGLLALEDYSSHIDDAYMQKGIRLTIDGTDPELIKDIMGTELIHVVESNRRQITFWENLGAYAPAWGMVGTLLGLINMMKNMGDDPGAVGAGMSLALLTTLYGSILANWICLPVASKLKQSSAQQEMAMELTMEGVLSIQAGDNPTIIKEKIRTFRSEWEEAEQNTGSYSRPEDRS